VLWKSSQNIVERFVSDLNTFVPQSTAFDFILFHGQLLKVETQYLLSQPKSPAKAQFLGHKTLICLPWKTCVRAVMFSKKDSFRWGTDKSEYTATAYGSALMPGPFCPFAIVLSRCIPCFPAEWGGNDWTMELQLLLMYYVALVALLLHIPEWYLRTDSNFYGRQISKSEFCGLRTEPLQKIWVERADTEFLLLEVVHEKE